MEDFTALPLVPHLFPQCNIIRCFKRDSSIETTDATVAVKSASNSLVSLLKPQIEQAFSKYQTSMKDDAVGRCSYKRHFRPLALVGNWLTFEDQLDTSCESEAHPSFALRFSTIDLVKVSSLRYAPSQENDLSIEASHSGGLIFLTDIFPARDILNSLNNDSVIRSGLSLPAKTLAGLLNDLGDADLVVPGQTCRFHLSKDYLSRFVFHYKERNKLAIRLQLLPVGGACREAKAELGLSYWRFRSSSTWLFKTLQVRKTHSSLIAYRNQMR